MLRVIDASYVSLDGGFFWLSQCSVGEEDARDSKLGSNYYCDRVIAVCLLLDIFGMRPFCNRN